MNKIFVEPFSLSKPPARKMIALGMILQTLMACNYQIIPFLFYRPKFYCDTPSGVHECHEVDACMQPTLNYRSDYTFSSIPQEFNLYCGNKHEEATILTFHMVGHLFGAICSTLLADLGHYQHKTLAVLVTASFISGISCVIGGLSSTTFLLNVCITFWSLSAEIILNFMNMVPTLFFAPSMAKRIFSIIVISWSMYATILPSIIRIHLSWRTLLIWNVGALHILWVLYVLYNFRELSTLNTEEQPLTESLQQMKNLTPKVEEVDPHAPPATQPHQISVGFKEMYKSTHFRNIMLYFIIYGGSYVASITSILSLGSITGNIYYNLTFINLAEICLSFLGGYLIHAFSVRESIKVIFLCLAITYSAYSFVPQLFRFLIVIEGKLLTDITWIMLNTYTVTISPKKYIPLIMATRGVYNISVCILMPYIKYFMEMIRLNIFVFSGAYEFSSCIAIRQIHERDITKD